jgi:DNA polymerase-3 subunit alpha
MDFTAKVAEYIHECKKMGIRLLPPDINEGYGHFSVSGDAIRFGLSAIKNVGRAAVQAITAERQKNGGFKGITDFISRMESGDINKRCLESLIKAGAFDSLGGKRSQYMTVYAGIMNGLSQVRKRTMDGQINLFEMDDTPEDLSADELPPIKELDSRILLANEKEVLGIYVSGHPLSEYEKTLAGYTANTSIDFLAGDDTAETRLKDGDTVKYSGIITDKSIKYTKANNKAMAFLTVEDLYGTVEVIVFSGLYEKYGARLQDEQVLVIQGRVSAREEEAAKIIAQDFLFYEDIQAAASTNRTLWVKIPKHLNVPPKDVTDILQAHHGGTPVIIYNERINQKLAVKSTFWVEPCPQLTCDIENLLGAGMVKIVEK